MPDGDNKFYVLRASEEHLRVVALACDVFSRLRIGQVEAMERAFPDGMDHWQGGYYINGIKALAFPGMHANASWGVGHDRTADLAYEFRKVVEHRLSWDRRPEGGMGVNFDDPARYSGTQLPQIECDDDIIPAMEELRETVARMDAVRSSAEYVSDDERLREYDKIAGELGETLKRVGLARRERNWRA